MDIPSLVKPESQLPFRKTVAAWFRAKSPALAPTGDALQGDEFRRTRQPYESIKTVTPVFCDGLTQSIAAEILRYEAETGRFIAPAYRFPNPDAPEAWVTNKPERLAPTLWIFAQLPPAAHADEAINQLACVIHQVEALAQRRYKRISHLYLPDPRAMRLTEALPETVQQQRFLVSLGTRHVTLFRADGAVQVQCLPERPEKLAYPHRAKIPGLVLLTKPGIVDSEFWA
jgi:hypothetical protein